MQRDDNPHLGTKSPSVLEVEALSTWASKNDQETITRRFLVAAAAPVAVPLLGTSLGFLASKTTRRLLEHWSSDSTPAHQLLGLADSLATDFPPLSVADTNASSRVLLRATKSSVRRNYLVALLCVRNVPATHQKDQLALTALRIWILLRALEFADRSVIFDNSLLEVCTQLRIGLEDVDGAEKLAWLAEVCTAVTSLHSFEHHLKSVLPRYQKGANWQTILVTAFEHLLRSEVRPITELAAPPLPVAGLHKWATNPKLTARQDGAVDIKIIDNPLEQIPVVAENEDGEVTYFEVNVPEDNSPAQNHRLATRLLLQTPEDRNYLPWSYSKLNPAERSALDRELLSQLDMSDKNLADQLLPAVVFLAKISRSSMASVHRLLILRSSETQPDWGLDLAAGVLRRLPPRPAKRRRATVATKAWIRPLAAELSFPVPAKVLAPLRSALKRAPDARHLGDFWPIDREPMEVEFDRFCRKSSQLSRVTSGMLGQTTEQILFEDSFDPVFTRMMTSTAKTAHGGAGSYASFKGSQIAAAVKLLGVTETAEFLELNSLCNSAGSEIDPIDDLIVEEFERARRTVERQRTTSENWIDAHNAVTLYTVTLLLAATGARPIKSPFESSHHFDLFNNRVFIEDKVGIWSGTQGAGRIVPLPAAASALLRDYYFVHLRHLASELAAITPALANEIDEQAAGRGSTKLPLFFLFVRRPTFDWIEVHPTAILRSGIVKWPLPLNVFRHRAAIRLREFGLDPELIEAQLGHGERGAETFGDHSVRCWQEDEPNWRTAVDAVFGQLKPRIPLYKPFPVNRAEIPEGYEPFGEIAAFGQAPRDRRRAETRKRIQAEVRGEIRDMMGERSVDQVPQVEWDRLRRSMIMYEDNRRRPDESPRLAAFEDFLQETWSKGAQGPKFKRHLIALQPARSAFLVQALHAPKLLTDLQNRLDQHYATLTKREDVGRKAFLLAIDLCLSSRITQKDSISRVAHGDLRGVSLVTYDGHSYIEFSDPDSDRADIACQRYLVPNRAGDLLNSLLKTTKKLVPIKPDDPWSLSLLELLGLPQEAPAVGDLCARLCSQVDQANSIELPRLQAAVLAGRVKTFSLDRLDWLRALTNKGWRDPSGTTSAEISTELDSQASPNIRGPGNEPLFERVRPTGNHAKNHSDKLNQAREFLAELRAAINHYKGQSKLASTSSANQIEVEKKRSPARRGRRIKSNTETSERETSRETIRTLINQSPLPEGSPIRAFGDWVLFLLKREARSNLLAASSVLRYMSALTPGFLSFGLDLDLAELDEDELTDFYNAVIEPSLFSGENSGAPSIDPEGDGEHRDADAAVLGIVSEQHPRLDQTYVLKRLREFHRFASARYGLADPDWGELSEGLSSATTSTGLITPADYAHTLESLCPDPMNGPIDAAREALLLLLTYRFGLRGGEAVALPRSGWIEFESAIVVVVKAKFADLKSRASQRQVPLLGTLSTLESQVVKRCFEYWDSETDSNDGYPIFFQSRNDPTPINLAIARTHVIAALRATTQNQRTNLHHARHSLANLAGIHLVDHMQAVRWSAVQETRSWQTDTKKLLVVRTHTSRRDLWAVARLLGHASPVTTCSAYLHFLVDWCNATLKTGNPKLFSREPGFCRSHAANMDSWQQDKGYLRRAISSTRHTPKSLSRILALNYCRVRAHGMPPSRAAIHCDIRSTDAQRFEAGLIRIGARLTGKSHTALTEIDAVHLPLFLLSKIPEAAWNRLQNLVARAQPIAHPLGLDCVERIGATGQILIWDRHHFSEVCSFIRSVGCEPDDFKFFWSASKSQGAILLKSWAQEFKITLADISSVQPPEKASGDQDGVKKKRFQIDTVLEAEEGRIPRRVEQRIALVRRAGDSKFGNNFELVLAWLILNAA